MEENFNIHPGKKLRLRRLSLGLTQTKVAQAINVTFQQIQKYEKGTNGVSSNRLMQLSQFLKVPIIYFFEDFKDFKDLTSNDMTNDDLNYSFLSRTFLSLSKPQKEKILQILNNTNKFEKSRLNAKRSFGSSGRTRTCDQLINSQLLYQLSYRGMKMNILFLKNKTTNFFGGHAQNRTGIKGFAILCVTIPPRGLNLP